MVFLNNWSTISETEHGFYGLVLSNICLSSLATVMNSWYPIYAFCACHHWHVSETQWQLFKRCHLVCPNISHSWPSAHSHPATQPSCKAPLGCLDESVIIIAFISINFFHASRLCILQHITACAVRTCLPQTWAGHSAVEEKEKKAWDLFGPPYQFKVHLPIFPCCSYKKNNIY